MDKQKFKELLSSDNARRLINSNDYDELYRWFEGCIKITTRTSLATDISQLTKFLYKCGINPLDYFKDYVPDFFMYRLDANTTNIGKEIIIPGNMKSIASYSFSELKNFYNIVVQEGVKVIGSDAFSNIYGLHTLVLPSTLSYISRSAFDGSTGFDIFYSGPKSKVPELFGSILEDEGIDIYYVENNEWIKY